MSTKQSIPNPHYPSSPSEGDLSVWWIPQIGAKGEAFRVSVSSVEEAGKTLDILAAYDGYQFDHRIKGDYSNTGGLDRCEDDGEGGWEWCSWMDEETGIEDVHEYLEEVTK